MEIHLYLALRKKNCEFKDSQYQDFQDGQYCSSLVEKTSQNQLFRG